MMSYLLRAAASSTILIAGLAAPPANAQSRFAIVGDIGSSSAAASVAKLIKDQGTEHVFTTGDNCYGRTPISTQIGSNYSSFVAARRFWPSLGNHDYSDACGNRSLAYLAYFNLPGNERHYDVRLGSVHFFVVNSDSREPNGIGATSRQAQWLKRRVQGSRAPWQVVVMHHPPFSSGEHGSTAAVRWPFEQWGVDAILNGHDHNYERILRDDNKDGRKLPYFISGLGGRGKDPIPGNVEGSAFKYSAEFGALLLNASPQQLRFEFRNIKGSVVDSYVVTK